MHTLLVREGADVGSCAGVALLFVHPKVHLPKCGYLRQVSDADHLCGFSHALHHTSHALCHRTAHTRVDLVENDGGEVAFLRNQGFEGEHYTSDFTARGCLRHILQRHLFVGSEEKAHRIAAHAVGTRTRGEIEEDLHRRHAQFLQSLGEIVHHLRCRLLSRCSELSSQCCDRSKGALHLSFCGSDARVSIVDSRESLAQILSNGEEFADFADLVFLF